MEKLRQQDDSPSRTPIVKLAVGGAALVLALIWLEELFDLPHVLFGTPPVRFSVGAALLHSAVVAVAALAVGLGLARLVRSRRAATESLRRVAWRFRILAEYTNDWVFWLSPEGEYLYSSPSCEKVSGYAPHEFAADRSLLERLVHPDDLETLAQHRAEIHESRAPGGVRFRIISKNAQVRWIDHVCRPMFGEDGTYFGIRGTNRDVTAQRRAEEALEASEVHLKRAQEVAELGSWELDLSTGNLFWSEEVYRIFGVLGGTPLDYEKFMEIVHPEDRERVDRAWRDALRGTLYDLEHRIHVNGRIRWVREKAEVEFGADGRAIRGIGIVQDLTARKAAEEETARLEAELAHIARVTTLNQFSAALAHELNQPLTAILSNAQAALRFLDAAAPDLDETCEILADIVADDQRARDVILKLRELTKKPTESSRPAPLLVNPLVEGVLGLVSSDLPMRRVSLDLRLGADIPRVSADAVQIQQALLNLILNALDAMEESPVRRLGLETRLGDAGAVEIAVKDTGRGITLEEAGNLFEAFFTTKEKGMGMGLAISRAIVESHGGRIRGGPVREPDAESGAEFVITLPRHEEGG